MMLTIFVYLLGVLLAHLFIKVQHLNKEDKNNETLKLAFNIIRVGSWLSLIVILITILYQALKFCIIQIKDYFIYRKY